jgi:hypothetical protein
MNVPACVLACVQHAADHPIRPRGLERTWRRGARMMACGPTSSSTASAGIAAHASRNSTRDLKLCTCARAARQALRPGPTARWATERCMCMRCHCAMDACKQSRTLAKRGRARGSPARRPRRRRRRCPEGSWWTATPWSAAWAPGLARSALRPARTPAGEPAVVLCTVHRCALHAITSDAVLRETSGRESAVQKTAEYSSSASRSTGVVATPRQKLCLVCYRREAAGDNDALTSGREGSAVCLGQARPRGEAGRARPRRRPQKGSSAGEWYAIPSVLSSRTNTPSSFSLAHSGASSHSGPADPAAELQRAPACISLRTACQRLR